MPSTTTVSGVQYSGIWTMPQVNAAVAAGTWPSPPTGLLLAFGGNYAGKLGLGDTTNRSSPAQVGTLATWTSKIYGGNNFTLAIKNDKTLWSWGYNASGQLGLGNASGNKSLPNQVGSLAIWKTVSGGGTCSAAITTSGTLWTWGGNDQGALGLGDTVNRSSPVQVGTLSNWLKVAGGRYSMAAIKTDGTLWTWGNNQKGELGLGTSSYAQSKSSPNQVGALTTWSQVACGNQHVLAIRTDGTLWSWGKNVQGQLGLGNTTYLSSPNQVGLLTDWLSVSSRDNANYSLALKTDGTLWAWGINTAGQLGIGDTNSRSSPVQVGLLTNWANVTSRSVSTGAIKTDGTLWSWGNGSAGQLGLNNTTYYSSPKQVGALTTWLSIASGQYFSMATSKP
jgi:alpha-tubulin suppressor-like RCC1 family protein